MSPEKRKNTKATVRSAVKRRGRAANNIWSVYSPKTDRRWILTKDLAEEHWLTLEADPNVASFELGPFENGDGEREGALVDVDAIVRMRTGAMELRQVRYSPSSCANESAHEGGGRTPYVVVTSDQLSAKSLLIKNFRLVVAAQTRTASHPPTVQRDEVEAHLRAHGHMTLGSVLEGAEPSEAALRLSAAYALLTEGIALSDLDTARLSTRTQLWLRE